ncbi:hypothetical protein AgCh_033906 [Apium graveolens]
MVENSNWLNTFSEGSVEVKNRGLMDHNPLLFEESMQLQKYGKYFQFFNYMIEILGFLDLVSSSWSLHYEGTPMAQFSAKLKHTKLLLKQLNRDHGNIQSNVIVARNALADFQVSSKESFLLQKARVKWLHLGDKNNWFFHQQCKVNWNRNKVLALVDGEGNIVHGQNKCAQVAVHYFSQLLGSPCQQESLDLSLVNCKELSEEQSLVLTAPITDLLIYDTIKRMKRNKEPGPDGVNVEFFIATWHIIGTSFCDAVKFFFASGSMHSGINSTFISLIPKTVAPTRMNDFRPISLSSVLYKCISKIITMRFKSIMPSVVDIAQSTFIPGRSISDNVLLAQELFRGYDRETGSPKCALKIDLHKAFDSLSWDFILAVLHKMRFPTMMITWIKSCICTTKFSVKLNGIIHGYFGGTKGLRQGDPMPSVEHIMTSITTFSMWSSLVPSITKSTGFVCNCDSNFLDWFDTLGIPRALVHATIQSLLTRFLWKGNINHKGGAKIAWSVVCLPKEEGGLGLKNMIEWNKAQLIAINTSGVDTILWDGMVATKIKTWNIWNSIRNRGDLVDWHNAVWHKLRINRSDSGPSKDNSPKGSTKSSTSVATKYKGNTPTSPPVLEDLHDNIFVHNGIITVYVPKETVVESSAHTEPVSNNDANTQNPKTWSSIITKTIPSKEPTTNADAKFSFNKDGLATIRPPKPFFVNARKNWSTSIIGHFIGGSFDFCFVREQAFKYWKNHGLSRVFYSSKGYFTFKFNSEKEKNDILGLNSVVMGGRTLYLLPWMETNKFKKNVIESVPC